MLSIYEQRQKKDNWNNWNNTNFVRKEVRMYVAVLVALYYWCNVL